MNLHHLTFDIQIKNFFRAIKNLDKVAQSKAFKNH